MVILIDLVEEKKGETYLEFFLKPLRILGMEVGFGKWEVLELMEIFFSNW